MTNHTNYFMNSPALPRLVADVLLVLLTSTSPLAPAIVFWMSGVTTPLISNELLLVAFFLCVIRIRDSMLVSLNRNLPVELLAALRSLISVYRALSVVLAMASLTVFNLVRYYEVMSQVGKSPINYSEVAGSIYLFSVVSFFLPYMADVPEEIFDRATSISSIIITGMRHVVLFSLPAALLTYISYKLSPYQGNFLNHVQGFGFWLALEVIFMEGVRGRTSRAA